MASVLALINGALPVLLAIRNADRNQQIHHLFVSRTRLVAATMKTRRLSSIPHRTAPPLAPLGTSSSIWLQGRHFAHLCLFFGWMDQTSRPKEYDAANADDYSSAQHTRLTFRPSSLLCILCCYVERMPTRGFQTVRTRPTIGKAQPTQSVHP